MASSSQANSAVVDIQGICRHYSLLLDAQPGEDVPPDDDDDDDNDDDEMMVMMI